MAVYQSKCCDCHVLHNSGNNLTQLEHSQKTEALIQVTAFQGDFTTTKEFPHMPPFKCFLSQLLSVQKELLLHDALHI